MIYILTAVAAFIGGFFGASLAVRPAKYKRYAAKFAKKIPVISKKIPEDRGPVEKWLYGERKVKSWN